MAERKHIEYNTELRIALLEQTNQHIYEVLNRMEKRFDKIDERFDKIDEKFDKLDERFERMEEKFDKKFETLNSKVDRHFYTLITLYVGGYAAMFSIMAKGFHWF